MLAECPGVVSRCGALGARRTRKVPGWVSRLRTRGASGCIRGSPGVSGHASHSGSSGEISLAGLAAHSGASGRVAAHSELPGTRGAFGASGVSLPAGVLEDRCCTRRLPGEVSLAAHSESSGVVSLAGLHGTLESFREGCVALGGFREEVLLTAHSDSFGDTGRIRRLPG